MSMNIYSAQTGYRESHGWKERNVIKIIPDLREERRLNKLLDIRQKRGFNFLEHDLRCWGTSQTRNFERYEKWNSYRWSWTKTFRAGEVTFNEKKFDFNSQWKNLIFLNADATFRSQDWTRAQAGEWCFFSLILLELTVFGYLKYILWNQK